MCMRTVHTVPYISMFESVKFLLSSWCDVWHFHAFGWSSVTLSQLGYIFLLFLLRMSYCTLRLWMQKAVPCRVPLCHWVEPTSEVTAWLTATENSPLQTWYDAQAHTRAMYACTDVENAVPVCLNCNRHKASITFDHFTVSMTLSLPQRMSLSQMEAQKRFSLWDTGQHSG